MARTSILVLALQMLLTGLHHIRVWKGIFGIQDLTKIRCGIRENTKYFDRKQDLTATRKAGFTKIWARYVGNFFACQSGIREIVHFSGNRESRQEFSGVPCPILSPSLFLPLFSFHFVILRYERLYHFCKWP